MPSQVLKSHQVSPECYGHLTPPPEEAVSINHSPTAGSNLSDCLDTVPHTHGVEGQRRVPLPHSIINRPDNGGEASGNFLWGAGKSPACSDAWCVESGCRLWKSVKQSACLSHFRGQLAATHSASICALSSNRQTRRLQSHEPQFACRNFEIKTT